MKTQIERDELIDGYFNQQWCCDLDEVKEAVFGTISDLEKSNDKKIEIIIDLKNRIDKAIEYIEEKTTDDNGNELGYSDLIDYEELLHILRGEE